MWLVPRGGLRLMEIFTKKNVGGEAVLTVSQVKVSCGGVTGEAIKRLAGYEMLLGKEPVEVKTVIDNLIAENAGLKTKYESALHALMKASLGHLCTECVQSSHCGQDGEQTCGSFEWKGLIAVS
jgi:hypothetical protein